jgi:hypothetical protein
MTPPASSATQLPWIPPHTVGATSDVPVATDNLPIFYGLHGERGTFGVTSNSAALGHLMGRTNTTATVYVAPLVVPLDEARILVGLNPSARWAYIARHNSVEFAASIAGIFIAIYVLVTNTFSIIPDLSFAVISVAFAQAQPDISKLAGLDLQMLVACVMSVGFLWLLGIISWSKTSSKITIAKENIKYILGFLGGALTGKAR